MAQKEKVARPNEEGVMNKWLENVLVASLIVFILTAAEIMITLLIMFVLQGR